LEPVRHEVGRSSLRDEKWWPIIKAAWTTAGASDTIPPTLFIIEASNVSHTKVEKTKLIGRVRRVRGQIEALERAIEEEKGCATVLHLIVAARGAINGLMAEVIEDHVRLHVATPTKDTERARGAQELIDAVQSYLR
jgi:DNA-binding FrmR family transcriptional regulator